MFDAARQAPTIACFNIHNFTINNEAQFAGYHNSSLFMGMGMSGDYRALRYFELTHQCPVTMNQGRIINSIQ